MAALVAATIGLVRLGGWNPFTAALTAGSVWLAFWIVIGGTVALFLPKERRHEFLGATLSVARKDLADIVTTLTFRRSSRRQ
jgi:hypothetical protein